MKRIAILGCENSHAGIFLSFIKEREEFSDVEVVGVYSEDSAAAEKLRDEFGVPVMKSFADAVGKIDGLVITARHGDKHYPYALPYLEYGIPTFIDKPITVSEEEAVELARLLKKNNVKVCGGSVLRYDDVVMRLKSEAEANFGGKTLGGYIRAPYQANNPYGGFFFYSPHGIEIVLQIFGRYPISVSAEQGDKQIRVNFKYGEYDCQALLCDEDYTYRAARKSESGCAEYEIPATNEWFYREFSEFYSILSGTADGEDYAHFIAPVFVLAAIYRSLNNGGREEKIRFPKI